MSGRDFVCRLPSFARAHAQSGRLRNCARFPLCDLCHGCARTAQFDGGRRTANLFPKRSAAREKFAREPRAISRQHNISLSLSFCTKTTSVIISLSSGGGDPRYFYNSQPSRRGGKISVLPGGFKQQIAHPTGAGQFVNQEEGSGREREETTTVESVMARQSAAGNHSRRPPIPHN